MDSSVFIAALLLGGVDKFSGSIKTMDSLTAPSRHKNKDDDFAKKADAFIGGLRSLQNKPVKDQG